MSDSWWSAARSRGILKRIVVEGSLVLEPPAHLGNGDGSDIADMPLLQDAVDGRPLLTGASLAGALRSALREREHPYGQAPARRRDLRDPSCYCTLLFGGVREDDDGAQSPLIVDDALASPAAIDIRDGVRLNPESRTAEHDALYSLDLWPAGTSFPIRLELLVTEFSIKEGLGEAWAHLAKGMPLGIAGQAVLDVGRPYLLRDGKPVDQDALEGAIATALSQAPECARAIERALCTGLVAAMGELHAHGRITLGARKRRGYGRIHAEEWRVRSYDMGNPGDLLTWLQHGATPLHKPPHNCETVGPPPARFPSLSHALGLVADGEHWTLPAHQRPALSITATFTVDGSLLIRAGGDRNHEGPDMVHLHAWQPDEKKSRPVLSGTSLAGALRARAFKIANTLAVRNDLEARKLVQGIFGPDMSRQQERPMDRDRPVPEVENVPDPDMDRQQHPKPCASRLAVSESVICESQAKLVQSRVSIDRFTGGARDGALFDEQPAFGGRVEIRLRLDDPKDHEAGLLLLLLKDLWTGALPVGGESSVGRGRLKGQRATIERSGSWVISTNQQNPEMLDIAPDERKEDLERWVEALMAHLRPTAAGTTQEGEGYGCD